MGNLLDNLAGVFLCDNCDTLATVNRKGDTIIVNKCECVTLGWSENV